MEPFSAAITTDEGAASYTAGHIYHAAKDGFKMSTLEMGVLDTNGHDISIAELRIKLFEARDQTTAMLEQRGETALAESVRIATVSEFITTIPTGLVLPTCLIYFGALSANERLPVLYLEAAWVNLVSSDEIAQVIYLWVHYHPIHNA